MGLGLALCSGLLLFTCGLAVGIKRGVPLMTRVRTWSIGIYAGASPLALSTAADVTNPVLTRAHVTDVDAAFVADPFVVREGSNYYMFFEVLNRATQHGDIALAVSPDGFDWTYQKVVIDEPFHMSYPYVFRWENDYYLIPETSRDCSVRLYKAVAFPTGWEFQGCLLEGYHFVDPSLFRYRDQWWLFAGFAGNDILRLYYADDLRGPWTEHAQSPIVQKDSRIARPAGRILQTDGRIFRFAQDDSQLYGGSLSAFEITHLSPDRYEEEPAGDKPVLDGTGTGWNGLGMHHLDLHVIDDRWIAYVDGFGQQTLYGLQY
jgi:hypothetical protein